MDDEHGECIEALNAFARERSQTSLRQVIKVLSEHFRHEEELMDTVKFGEHVVEKLSAKRTHVEDHARMLDTLRQELKRRREGGSSSKAFVDHVLRDFKEHAE